MTGFSDPILSHCYTNGVRVNGDNLIPFYPLVILSAGGDVLKEALRLAVVYVFTIGGALVVGVSIASLFVYCLRAYADGWTYLFGAGGMSIFCMVTSLLLYFCTVCFYYMQK
jgi:uncharacterized membrane protein YraQ (UPF0718 family)